MSAVPGSSPRVLSSAPASTLTGQGGQEPGAAFSGHNERLAGRRQLGRQRRREKPVGDAHPATPGPVTRFPAPGGPPGDHGLDRGGNFGRQGRVPPK